MKVVAITGSIGCGKTTLAGLLRELGYVVYDADNWCRLLYHKPDFIEQIHQIFPETFQNGVFNKRVLRELVFADSKKLKKLESIIHPLLKKRFLKAIHRNAFNNEIIFIDVAILFEMGWHKYCTKIIVADVDPEIQKRRVMIRDNVSEEAVQDIINVQIDNKIKKTKADFVIDTDKSLGKLKIELMNIIDWIELC